MTTAYESGRVPQIGVRHRLRIAREEAGLEQSELADLIGISRTTVGNAEKGRVEPRKITVNAWALATGVPVSWLQTGDVPRNPNGPDGATFTDNHPTGGTVVEFPDRAVAFADLDETA